MNYILYIIVFDLFIFLSCSDSESQKKKIISKNDEAIQLFDCANSHYDSMLVVMSNEFEPRSIELDSSLSPTTSSFLLKVDTICLRKQAHYERFIALILAKLYAFHLSCCNQGYDLLSMNKGPGLVIVQEFKRLSGYDKKSHLEFLNSGKIVDYIKSKTDLSEDSKIKATIQKIDREGKRIEKGVM